ncbi:aminoacyl-tRNA deacylase [Anaerolineales bacterium]
MSKLTSIRFLEQQKTPYEIFHYDPALGDAVEVAQAIGFPEYMVYKTLLVGSQQQNKPIIVMIPSQTSLDLKRLAQAVGEKKVQMLKHREAEALSGLQVGGISALALTQKNWQVYMDNSANQLQYIIISAGERGTQVRVPVIELMRLLRVRLIDVAIDEDDVT